MRGVMKCLEPFMPNGCGTQLARAIGRATGIGVIALLSLPAPGFAQSTDGVPNLDDVAQVTIRPGWRQSDGTHIAALEVVLAPGWKTYWRAPGEGGIPPRFDFAPSRGLKAVAIEWPVPDVFDIGGMQTIAYQDRMILPLILTPKGAGDIRLKGRVELGVCENICIPISRDFDVVLAASAGDIDATISAARDQVAVPSPLQVRCDITPISDGLHVSASVPGAAIHDAVGIVEYADQTVWVGQMPSTRVAQTYNLRADLVPPQAAPFALARQDLTFTILGRQDGKPVARAHQGCAG